MISFIAELKRRNVIRAAGLYLVGAWLVVQVSSTVLPMFGAPAWLPRSIVILLLVGFIPALVFSWVFELTPEGIKRDDEVTPEESILPQTARKMDRAIIAVLALALLYFGFDKFVLTPSREAAQIAQVAHAAALHNTTHAESAISTKSIAVLPFIDLSPGHDQDYFSDGMSEEILNALAQVKDLKVAGRTSSFYFKGRSEDLRTIGKTLGVANILEGSVRKQGDKVRITAQLIQVSDDTHLWSHAYDGDLSNVFELQESIARSITDALKVVLVGEQKTRLVPIATTSSEAYPLYLQATAIFNRRDGAHIPDAIADLQQAIRLDPKYARAHARLASLYAIANTYNNTLDLSEALAAGEHEAKVATALDPTLGEPYAALGTMYELRRQWIAGRDASERAVALEPGDPTANFWLGLAQIDAGYRRRGIASIDRALAIDPLLPNALAWRAFCYFDAGDRDEARRMAQRSVDEGLLFGEVVLAMLAHEDGHDADAIAHFTRSAFMALKGFPDDATAILARGIYGDAAAHAKAVAMIDVYLATRPKTISPRTPWAFLLLGEPAHALAIAQETQASNDTLFLVWVWSSRGAAARHLPQFPEFARKMGLFEIWDQYGPPDACQRKGPGDYVCE